MTAEFDDREPSLKLEEVERRGEPRGLLSRMSVSVSGGDAHELVEASRKGLFILVDDPEQYRLGDSHDAKVSAPSASFDCKIEVVRKEIVPRRGVALRIAHMSPVAEETLKKILEGG